MFNFSKNILRLDKEKNIFFGTQKIQNKYLKRLFVIQKKKKNINRQQTFATKTIKVLTI